MRDVLARRQMDLDKRLAGLRAAVDAAEGRLGEQELAPARAVLDRAGERMVLGVEQTVAALAGATGSGKSSLFNALAGTDLSPVGVLRPTTGTAHAAVWGEGADRLLDWLDIGMRHQIGGVEDLEGLVLLDLPDHDSTQTDHRVEVDRLVGLVDVFIWVVDPQKYADAALHAGYLEPLARHSAVTVVVMNHTDSLHDPQDERRCVTDLQRLLARDGLKKVPVLTTSARTGKGIQELRSTIAARVRERRAAAERLSADVDRVAEDLNSFCAGSSKTPKIGRKERDALVAALSVAAGVERVTEASALSYRRDAALATGWPFTRWARRFRPDPLARLHLRGGGGGRTSLPPPGAPQRAIAESAIRDLAERASGGLPQPWPRSVRARGAEAVSTLLDELDRAVGRADLVYPRRPVWWSLASAVQTLLASAAIVGFLWLTVLFALEWLNVPRPPTPELERVPWPTLLLLGGLLAGFALAALFGVVGRIGAARRRRAAYRSLRGEVAEVAQEQVVGPIEEERDAYRRFCDALGEIKR